MPLMPNGDQPEAAQPGEEIAIPVLRVIEYHSFTLAVVPNGPPGEYAFHFHDADGTLHRFPCNPQAIRQVRARLSGLEVPGQGAPIPTDILRRQP